MPRKRKKGAEPVTRFPMLEELRARMKLSQAEVGRAIGVSQQTMSKLGSGTHELKFYQAIKLADFYRVSLDVLAGREPPPPLPGSAALAPEAVREIVSEAAAKVAVAIALGLGADDPRRERLTTEVPAMLQAVLIRSLLPDRTS